MKSFVIYLTIFFVVTTYIRGFLGLDNYKFYENPYLKEKLKSKKETSTLKTIDTTTRKFASTDKPLLKESVCRLDYSSILGTKLQPIEQKYLQLGIEKSLAKEWFSKNINKERFKLIIDIKKNDISTRKYVTEYEGKRHYRIDQKSSIKIHYKVYNNRGKLVTKGFIPYNVLIKAASYWDFIESERLAKKRLFLRVGEKIASSLNSKRFYIFNSK